MHFETSDIIKWINEADESSFDKTDFGIIGFDNQNIVKKYNLTEEKYSGLSKKNVLNKNLFLDVAPCMNNYLVSLKFEEKKELDEIIHYILSFKVKPCPVDLRLIKSKSLELNFILIKRLK